MYLSFNYILGIVKMTTYTELFLIKIDALLSMLDGDILSQGLTTLYEALCVYWSVGPLVRLSMGLLFNPFICQSIWSSSLHLISIWSMSSFRGKIKGKMLFRKVVPVLFGLIFKRLELQMHDWSQMKDYLI